MKVGLVLGAGGVLGGAWLTGGLNALATRDELGSRQRRLHRRHLGRARWSGSLVAAGVPPWFMVAHSRGETFSGVTDADGRPAAEADRAAGAVFRVHRGLTGLGPRVAAHGGHRALGPAAATAAQLVAGWLPAA